MSKRRYYDLFAEISRMMMPQDERVGIAIALHWLDRHPDQVPGRTITASELGRHAHLIRSIPIAGQAETPSIIDFLEAIGITVVPDPEPTNAEKLEKAITNAAHGVGIGSTTANIKAIAEHLDDAGVKAPGASDA